MRRQILEFMCILRTCFFHSYEKVGIATVNADVVIITLPSFDKFGLEKLWIDYESSNYRRWIYI